MKAGKATDIRPEVPRTFILIYVTHATL